MRLLVLGTILSSCASYKGTERFQVHDPIFYTPAKAERQKGEISIPEGKGPFPGVILVHGGGWKSRSYEDMRSIAKSLSSRGFVVFNINYRLSPKHRHPAPIDDLEAALRYFKKNAQEYKLDPNHLGLWGYSSGAHTVSYFALTKALDPELRVQAVVSGGAPYDFTWYTKSPYVKGYVGHYRDDAFQEYIDASAVFKITKEAPPFYLYHAEKDTLVEHSQTTSFEARLKSHGVPVERYDIKFWGHMTGFIFSNQAVKEGVQFLERRLKVAPPS